MEAKTNRRHALQGLLPILLVLTGPRLFAAGGMEDPIREARDAIVEQRYDDARIILEQIVREDPERLVQAEQLLNVIRNIQTEYNEKFEELVTVLREEPDNYEKAIQIIDEMEAVDQSPVDKADDVIVDAQRTARLQSDRATRDRLLAEAASQLAEGDAVGAIRTYVEGFTLQRPEYDAQEFDETFRRRTDDALSLMKDASERVAVQAVRSQAILDRLLETELTLAEAVYDEYEPQFLALARAIEDLTAAAGVIAQSRREVAQSDPDGDDDPHLRFMSIFAYGRQDFGADEGLLAAGSQILEPMRPVAANHLHQMAETAWNVVYNAYSRGEWGAAANPNPETRDVQFAAMRALYATDLRALQVPISSAQAATLSGSFDRTHMVSHATIAELLPYVSAAAKVFAAYEEGAIDEDDDIARLRDVRRRVADGRSDAIATLEAFRASPAATQPRASLLSAAVVGLDRRLDGDLSAHIALLQTEERDIVDRVASLEYARFAARRSTAAENRVDADVLLLGETGEGADVVRRYPDRSLPIYTSVEEALSLLDGELAEFIGRYRAEVDFVAADPRVVAHVEAAETMRADIAEERTLVAARIRTADERIAEAARLRREFAQLMDRAEALVDSAQLIEADRAYNDARRLSFDALELQEDQDFREASDIRVATVGEAIKNARAAVVVRQVREYLDEAQDLFDRERLDEAWGLVSEAEELYLTVYDQVSPEIARLSRLIGAARLVQGGRDLEETDPLYPILGSYLSRAQVDLEQARRWIRSGRDDVAEPLIVRAEESFGNVLLARPFNWEARLGILRVQELSLSPAEFDTFFARRYEEQVERLDDPEVSELEVLTELEALAELNPTYPGLATRIRQIKVEVGLLPNPVTQARLAEAARLLDQAQELATSNDDVTLGLALERVEASIAINPDNRDAQVLADTLRIRLGGTATVALSAADEQLFQRAQDLFVSGAVASARIIVLRLLQDQDNQRYPPLLSLRDRIDRRL